MFFSRASIQYWAGLGTRYLLVLLLLLQSLYSVVLHTAPHQTRHYTTHGCQSLVVAWALNTAGHTTPHSSPLRYLFNKSTNISSVNHRLSSALQHFSWESRESEKSQLSHIGSPDQSVLLNYYKLMPHFLTCWTGEDNRNSLHSSSEF